MRVLGFTKKWSKLKQEEFTTFRFHRRDRDWEAGEFVQVVYKPRSKDREPLGIAKILTKEQRNTAPDWGGAGVPVVTNEEAIEDGFANWGEMFDWLAAAHGLHRLATETMNKFTLRWVETEFEPIPVSQEAKDFKKARVEMREHIISAFGIPPSELRRINGQTPA